MRRPSHSELRAKILKARQKIAERDWLPANIEKLLPEFQDLGLCIAEEFNAVLEAAANEIAPEHYTGTSPPQKAYEQACKEAELFAFSWESEHFGQRMYFKFCFVKETLFITSFHRDKPRGKEETT